ncbi:hypothetical protein B0G57_10839 [Trinickia symbiotica]|nr:hypothetical protein [Trinickia symbiotica]PPK44459.1 hypothetical protein B0G57_10839 [Trinickia symbiotica]
MTSSSFRPTRREWLVLVLIVVFAPLALLGMLSFPNEYEAMGSGGIDCDGPIQVLMCSIPALIIYLVGLACFIGKAWRYRQATNVVAATVCVVVCAALMINVALACRYYFNSEYQSVCEAPVAD